MWRKAKPHALLVGMQIDAAAMENSMECPQNIKHGSALWPSNSTSGDMSQETQNTNLKEYMHPYVHSSAICNSQAVEATQLPISQQVG